LGRLVLLDRDGVINVDRPDSVKSLDELTLIAGAAAAIGRLNTAGIKVAVVTNQAVVGRGVISHRQLDIIHERLAEMLAREGARLDGLFVCTDPPGAPSQRRKPRPGMLIEAMQRFAGQPAGTPMIGDSLTDLEAAHAAGCPRMLVRTGKGTATQAAGVPAALLPVSVHADLAAAVDALLAQG
jgi:D-glycero-D-manno-heptose 1,7-bisphosphate phosphatase